MYYDISQILADHIYGVGVTLTNYQDVVMTLLATLACLLTVAVPFLVAWRIIRLFVG